MSDAYTKLLEEGSEDIKEANATSIMNIFDGLRERFNLDISEDHYRRYIVFFTGTFVAQVVLGKVPDTDESIEYIANLLFGGLMTTLPGMTLEKLYRVQ